MNRLTKNISANLLSNAWATILMLLATPVYIGFLGVESYGLIGFYLSLLAMVGILDTGLSATTVREIAWRAARPEESGEIPLLLWSLEVVYWGVIVVLGAASLVAAWFWGAGWFHTKSLPPILLREALLMMAVALVVQVPSGLYLAGMMGMQRQVECSALVALFGAVRVGGAVLLMWQINPDIRLFFGWQIVSSALQTGVMRRVLWNSIPVTQGSLRFSPKALRAVQGFAGGMTLITALSLIMSQADKLILSRAVPLDVFGFYMLAWAVASGLSRVATPLIQAVGPHFTELISKGDDAGLARQLRLASQLMSVMILPPAAFLVFFAEPILTVWTGNSVIAVGAAPLLAVVVAGTVFTSCSYPALSILYSRKLLRPVIIVNLLALVVLLPLLVAAVFRFGAMGAAFCWGIYGVFLYCSYQGWGLRGIPKVSLFTTMFRDFVVPCGVSFLVAGLMWSGFHAVNGKMAFVLLLSLGVICGWIAALLACRDLFKVVVEKMKWQTQPNL